MRLWLACVAAALLLIADATQVEARWPTFGGVSSTSPSTPRALTGGNPGPSLAMYNSPPYQCLTNDYVNVGGAFTDANGNVWGAGSDSNPGSSFASPWQTYDHAVTAVTAAGSCIIVAPGVAGRTSVLTITHGGNAATPTGYIVWRCSVMPFSFSSGALQGEGNGCVIRATAPFPVHQPPANNIDSLVIVGAPYVWLDALEFDGNNYNVPFLCASSDGSANNDHLWFTNNDAHGCAWGGIGNGQTEYQYLLHNIIHNNSGVDSYPGYCCGSNSGPYGPENIVGYSPTAMDNEWCETTNCYQLVYAYNILRDARAPVDVQNDSNGILVDNFDFSQTPGLCAVGHSCPFTGHLLIMGNLVHHNDGRGLGVFLPGTSGYITVIHNTAYDDFRNFNNSLNGEFSFYGTAGMTVASNIAFTTQTNIGPVSPVPFYGDGLYQTNLSYPGGLNTASPYPTTGTNHNLDGSDPLFVSVTPGGSANNFALQQGSPAKGFAQPFGLWVNGNDAGACPSTATQCP